MLDISFDECLVTDESLIDDFLNEESPNDFEQRFREKYGFELSDVGSDVIVRILSKIAAMQDQPPPS